MTEAYLDRIARFDGQLRAFTAVDADGARSAAGESARRIAGGAARALEGVPVAIKANIAVRGLATTAGVAARRGAVADADAAVVTRLRDAGAVILGHVNMHEAALGATTDNAAYGRTENAHRSGHTPGGSSGGSGAAVAAGLCAAALGTDTLGSVRIPASYNGIYGLKPTNGLVGDDGVVPLSRRLDCVGPLARSVADLAAVMHVIGDVADAPASRRIATLTVVDDDAETEPPVRDAFALALSLLEGLGCTVTRHAAPGLDLTAARMGGFVEAARAGGIEFAGDAALADGISPEFRAMLGYGAAANPQVLAYGEAAMAAAKAALDAVLGFDDVIAMPTCPQAAFAHGRAPVTQADFTALANLAGLPALSLPAGWTDTGLPVGVQLVGRAGSETSLLALAADLDAVLRGYRFPVDY